MPRGRLRPAHRSRAMAHGRRSETEKEYPVHDLTTRFASRASRRGVLKGGVALGIGAVGLGSLSSHPAAAAEDSLEIFSWWTSPGESKALQALFDAFTAANPGVKVVNATVAGGAGVNAKAVLQTRLQGGQPPDSWQTHVGR